MKKTKVIALVLCVAIMLMGAGYAAWTDTLNVSTTVNTGDLDVEFVDLPGETELTLPIYTTGHVAYSQDLVSEWDVATTTIDNVYPGGSFSMRYKMINSGTIPVKLTSLGLDYGKFSEAAGGVAGNEGISSGIIGLKVFEANGTLVNFADSNLVNPFSVATFNTLGVPVGGSIEVYINFGAVDYPENHSYIVTMEPTFAQFNK